LRYRQYLADPHVKTVKGQTVSDVCPVGFSSFLSLSLAPSNFFLFEYLKQKILDLEFDHPDARLDEIKSEFQRISGEIRAEKCIECQGDNFSED
jgi:hypothetical protein